MISGKGGGKPVQTLGQKGATLPQENDWQFLHRGSQDGHKESLCQQYSNRGLVKSGAPQRGRLKQRECEWKTTDLKLDCALLVGTGAPAITLGVRCRLLSCRCDCLKPPHVAHLSPD